MVLLGYRVKGKSCLLNLPLCTPMSDIVVLDKYGCLDRFRVEVSDEKDKH